MQWTSIPPTTPGWYWWRYGPDDTKPIIREVYGYRNTYGPLVTWWAGRNASLELLGGEWSDSEVPKCGERNDNAPPA